MSNAPDPKTTTATPAATGLITSTLANLGGGNRTYLVGFASVLLGLAIGKLNAIERNQEKQNSKLFNHLTQSGIHESAVARIDERIASLLKTVEIAHERIDAFKGRG